ncbi:ABC transporter ATP-binding protein [Devosia sp. 63-57]|uniref:ABC transporter ATP-binding protein n=1 Tax=Devosia sp. 63-57 TaxID=1895751 RepID=UPI00086B4D5D|nr:ABC transporter ATP-binding protein [Devosia sp. 63-57]ODT48034.1 MAG: ABC transporter ATP-binding protein [Pelagibacterium sp. SCN 63-126]ODU85559.1 MAG: ABC transporter ATP-binding protein [Pelagibacterium sp. SCN 63-17]OJX42258.1 MAG: ABC transporter ATP-binding protein [Devosia sp. 63-57]
MIGLNTASVRFGDRTIFENLSFSVPKGECMAILGPNGRGKTTALRAMLGFQRIDTGQRRAPDIVGYVPQTATSQASYRVIDVVVMGRAAGLGLFGQPKAEDFAVVRQALERVGAARFEAERFDHLSGGERQLVLLARAMATGSDVLVLDEPGAALDLANQQRLLTLLDGLRQSRDKAIVFTTHDPNHALAIADTALLMLPNGPALKGKVDEVVTPEHLQRLYGVPMCFVALEGTGQRAVLPAFAGARAA